MIRKILLYLFLPSFGIATTTASITIATAQQAVLHTVTDQQVACTIQASTSTTYSPSIFDLDTTKFAGSNSDARTHAVVAGNDRIFIIGKRAAELNPTGTTAYSRSLTAETQYFWKETCGSDVVVGTFTTTSIKFGTAYSDPRYDRARPGETQWPTMDFTTNTVHYADPFTGADVIRITASGSIGAATTTELFSVFKTTLNGVGYTIATGSATYNGTSQNYIFLKSSATTILNGTDDRDLTYIQLNATIKGTSSVDVCLSLDGQTCTGATVNQPITSSFVPYVIGSTVPMLASWVNTPRGQVKARNVHQNFYIGTVASDKRNVAIAGPAYFETEWSSGSVILIGTTTVAISSVTNQNNLTLAADGPVGTFNMWGQNFGFLIKDHAGTNDTFTVNGASWTLSVQGYAAGLPSGAFRLCSPVNTVGPTGNGTLCWLAGYSDGTDNNLMFWIGDDGTANMIGSCEPNVTGTNLASNALCYGSVAWDNSVPGQFYQTSYRSDGAPIVYRTTYSGSYGPSNYTFGTPMPNSSTTIVSGDLNAMLLAFDSRFSSTSYTSWNTYGYTQYGAKGALIAYLYSVGQNSPGWIAVYDLNTNSIIAAVNTVLGRAGQPNRWGGLHGIGISEAGSWLSLNLEDGSLFYFVGLTSNTFEAGYHNCPSNEVDPTLAGQAQCSGTVVLSTDTPNNAGVNLYNLKVSTGDVFLLRVNGVQTERVRVLTLTGLNAVFQRCLEPWYFTGCGDHTSFGTIDLMTTVGPNNQDVNWNFVDDPHAVGLTQSYGSTFAFDPISNDCHQNLANPYYIMACFSPPVYTGIQAASYPIRAGPMPNMGVPLTYNKLDPGFSADQLSEGNNLIGSHPSNGNSSPWFFDTRPLMGIGTICQFGNCAKIAGTAYMYKAPASATAVADYRVRPYVLYSGEKQAADISPAIIADTTADNYKFCYTVIAGDCYAGSVPGDVYMNMPFVTQTDGNIYFLPPDPYTRDLSLGSMEANFDDSTQMLYTGFSDNEGANIRLLTSNMKLPRIGINYDNGRQTLSGKWFLQNTWHTDLTKNDIFISKIPSIVLDNKSRFTYMKVPVSISGTANDSIRVRFGYGEYGTPAQFFCSPRQVSCATDSTGAKPYLWTDETQQWKACGSSNCSIDIPILPGHIAYYVVDRRDASGRVFTSPVHVATVDSGGASSPGSSIPFTQSISYDSSTIHDAGAAFLNFTQNCNSCSMMVVGVSMPNAVAVSSIAIDNGPLTLASANGNAAGPTRTEIWYSTMTPVNGANTVRVSMASSTQFGVVSLTLLGTAASGALDVSSGSISTGGTAILSDTFTTVTAGDWCIDEYLQNNETTVNPATGQTLVQKYDNAPNFFGAMGMSYKGPIASPGSAYMTQGTTSFSQPSQSVACFKPGP